MINWRRRRSPLAINGPPVGMRWKARTRHKKHAETDANSGRHAVSTRRPARSRFTRQPLQARAIRLCRSSKQRILQRSIPVHADFFPRHPFVRRTASQRPTTPPRDSRPKTGNPYEHRQCSGNQRWRLDLFGNRKRKSETQSKVQRVASSKHSHDGVRLVASVPRTKT